MKRLIKREAIKNYYNIIFFLTLRGIRTCMCLQVTNVKQNKFIFSRINFMLLSLKLEPIYQLFNLMVELLVNKNLLCYMCVDGDNT